MLGITERAKGVSMNSIMFGLVFFSVAAFEFFFFEFDESMLELLALSVLPSFGVEQTKSVYFCLFVWVRIINAIGASYHRIDPDSSVMSIAWDQLPF